MSRVLCLWGAMWQEEATKTPLDQEAVHRRSPLAQPPCGVALASPTAGSKPLFCVSRLLSQVLSTGSTLATYKHAQVSLALKNEQTKVPSLTSQPSSCCPSSLLLTEKSFLKVAYSHYLCFLASQYLPNHYTLTSTPLPALKRAPNVTRALQDTKSYVTFLSLSSRCSSSSQLS